MPVERNKCKMDPNQMQFYHFILDCVEPVYYQEARDLVNDTYMKKRTGNYTQEYAEEFMTHLLSLLKLEKIEEVEALMTEFND
jgi:hypothetical protein